MSSEGLEMFEGNFAEIHPRKISAHIDGGPRGGSSVRRPGSKDPHQRECKFCKPFRSIYQESHWAPTEQMVPYHLSRELS